jgi:hypothetical protein
VPDAIRCEQDFLQDTLMRKPGNTEARMNPGSPGVIQGRLLWPLLCLNLVATEKITF